VATRKAHNPTIIDDTPARIAPGPPTTWQEEQRRADVDRLHTARWNPPVPRQASCHYYHRDQDPRNIYFY
jgi:hypothetical protein